MPPKPVGTTTAEPKKADNLPSDGPLVPSRFSFSLPDSRIDTTAPPKSVIIIGAPPKSPNEAMTLPDEASTQTKKPDNLLPDNLLGSSKSSSKVSPSLLDPYGETSAPPKQSLVIGIAGGTGSGKTRMCNMIIQQLRGQRVKLISQDSFYRDLTNEQLKHVQDHNFDHPDALDTGKLCEYIHKLKSGESVKVPTYDFKNHRLSTDGFQPVKAFDVIILKGILLFHDKQVRDLMDMKIFIDADDDERLARRIIRDRDERGRDVNSIIDQYLKFAKPAFDAFIFPSKKYADVIIPWSQENPIAIDLIVQHIREMLGHHNLSKIYPNLIVLQSTLEIIRGLHTLIRDREISEDDFIFHSERLSRLVVEHGLGCLPFKEKQLTTPTGSTYTGVSFSEKVCGVSIIRGGESMENALRASIKGIKIGKILIDRSGDKGKQLPKYEKLPKDISERHVLLLDPVLATGNSAVQAIEFLIKEKGVEESKIIFLNLISAPDGINEVCERFPSLKIVTSEIVNKEFRVIPGIEDFADRYFGTVAT